MLQRNLFTSTAGAEQASPMGDVDGLRPYQRDAVNACLGRLATDRAALIVLPTGLGKTQVGGAIVKAIKGRVLWIAHRDFLLSQARQRVESMIGEQVSVEKAEWFSSDTRVVVGSVQTLRGDRLARHAYDAFSAVIVDEAHHAVAASYRAVFERFPGARIIGLTATPVRADKIGMHNVFGDREVYRKDIDWAIDQGYFVPVLARSRFVESIHLEGVRTTAGDLNLGGLEEQITRNAAAIAQITSEECGTRQTIVYTPGVASAKAVAATLRELGRTAEALDGESSDTDRARAMKQFRSHELQYLVNCALYLEGLDLPNCDAIVIARPTKSSGLYQQMAGRGGRPEGHVGQLATAEDRRMAIASGRKPNFLLLDITGHAGRHALSNAANAMAGELLPEVKKRVAKAITDGAVETVDKLVEQAKRDVALEEKHAAEKAALANQKAIAKAAARARVKSRSGTWDVFRSLGVQPKDESVIEPGWYAEPASDEQVQWLRDNRLPWANQTKGHVDRLKTQARKWRNQGMATFRQRNVLSRAGCPVDVKIELAGKLITYLKGHGWKISDAMKQQIIGGHNGIVTGG